MALQGTFVWLSSLAVLSFAIAQDDTCSRPKLEEDLSALLKTANLLSQRTALKPKFPKMEAWHVSQLPTSATANLCATMGYDFDFIRRSRVFEECSEQTGYKWQTQYIGGNRLAVCNEAKIQVSGAKTAYFPEDQSCLTTKSTLHSSFIENLTTELKNLGIQGETQSSCLVCG